MFELKFSLQITGDFKDDFLISSYGIIQLYNSLVTSFITK